MASSIAYTLINYSDRFIKVVVRGVPPWRDDVAISWDCVRNDALLWQLIYDVQLNYSHRKNMPSRPPK